MYNNSNNNNGNLVSNYPVIGTYMMYDNLYQKVSLESRQSSRFNFFLYSYIIIDD